MSGAELPSTTRRMNEAAKLLSDSARLLADGQRRAKRPQAPSPLHRTGNGGRTAHK